MLTLVGLSYSAWTEKARWALEHHGVRYRFIEYLPMLGTPFLRLKARRFRGPLSVPMLFDGEMIVEDSFSIARYAERLGSGQKLFGSDQIAQIEHFNRLSEQGLAAARALITRRVLRSPQALEENLPRQVPGFLRALSRPVARMGAEYLMRKYGFGADSDETSTLRLTGVLDALEGALAKSAPYLLGRFSYADIAAAVVLNMVMPLPPPHFRSGPANRDCWTSSDLAYRYRTLVEWRDTLYAEHRRR